MRKLTIEGPTLAATRISFRISIQQKEKMQVMNYQGENRKREEV